MARGPRANLVALVARHPDKFKMKADGEVYRVFKRGEKRDSYYNPPVYLEEILWTLKVKNTSKYYRKNPKKGEQRNSAKKEFTKFKHKLSDLDIRGDYQSSDRYLRRLKRSGSYLLKFVNV